MIDKDGKIFLTTKEASVRMEISKGMVRELCNQNLLPGAYKKRANGSWLIPETSVDEWIKNPKKNRWTTPRWWKNRQRNPWVFYTGIIISGLVTLIGLFTVVSVISDAGSAKQNLINWGIVKEFPSEDEGETLVVIASFYYPDNVLNTDAQNEIRRAIENSARELGVSNVEARVSSIVLTADDRSGAEKLGNRYDASLVIWGADTGLRVTANFINLKNPEADAAIVVISETGQTQVASPDAYSTFILDDLPSRLTFLSLFALGQSYSIEGKYEESARAIQVAIDSLYPTVDNIEGLGEAYFKLGWLYTQPLANQEKAITYYTRALEFEPDEPAIFLNRGVSYSKLGNIGAAEDDYKKSLQLKPDFISALSNYGLLLAEGGRSDEALVQYQQALNLDPEDVVTLNNRGVLKYQQGDVAGALADFNEGIKIDPTVYLSYNNRAMISYDRGDYQNALKDTNFSIDLFKLDARSYFNRGLTHKALEDYDKALSDYDHAISLDPSLIWAYIDRGIVYKRLGKIDLALQDYYSALKIDPESSAAYFNIGIALRLKGDIEAAIMAFDTAIEIDPTNAMMFGERGCAKMEVTDIDLALTDLNRATELDPNYAEAYWCRGIALARTGKYEEALANIQQYVVLDPDAADDEDVVSITTQLYMEIQNP